jgi:hypothetical protein
MGCVQRYSSTDEVLQCRCIDPVTVTDADGASRLAFEAGVEEPDGSASEAPFASIAEGPGGEPKWRPLEKPDLRPTAAEGG